MNAADLELSHSIELEVWSNHKKTTLLTTVEKVIDNTVLLTPLRINGKLLGFPPTCTVNLLYPTQNHVYAWQNVEIKAVKMGGEVYHCAMLYDEAIPTNRRGSYRVFLGQEMTIHTFTSQGPKPLKCIVKDVSEGGFAFFSKEDFEVGRTVRLHLRLKNAKELQLTGQIVRIQEDEGRKENLYGCKLSEKNPLLARILMQMQQERQKQKMGLK